MTIKPSASVRFPSVAIFCGFQATEVSNQIS
jgi:hypothetical protein